MAAQVREWLNGLSGVLVPPREDMNERLQFNSVFVMILPVKMRKSVTRKQNLP